MGSTGGVMKETLFISHGSPTLSIDDSLPARHFLKSFTQKVSLSQRPTSILVISAHWETDTPAVNVISGANDTIYDFYGFPKPMYQVPSSLTKNYVFVAFINSGIHNLYCILY